MQLGANAIDKLYVGGTEATKAYLGSNQVYPSAFTGTSPVAGVPISAWYDASDAATITIGFGDVVTSWDDKSDNGYDFSAFGSQVAKVVGNTIEMNEGSFRSIIPQNTFDDCFNIYMVIKGLDPAADAHTYSRVFSSWKQFGVGAKHQFLNTTGQAVGTNMGASPNDILVNCSHTAGVINLREDGTEIQNATGSSWGGVDQALYFAFGSGYYVGQVRASEVISEIILTNDNTLLNRQKLEGYLAWKWGLEGNLPVGHPYKGAAP